MLLYVRDGQTGKGATEEDKHERDDEEDGSGATRLLGHVVMVIPDAQRRACNRRDPQGESLGQANYARTDDAECARGISGSR